MYFNRSLVLFCGLFASLVFSSGIVFSSFPQVCHSASVALTFALRRALGGHLGTPTNRELSCPV